MDDVRSKNLSEAGRRLRRNQKEADVLKLALPCLSEEYSLEEHVDDHPLVLSTLSRSDVQLLPADLDPQMLTGLKKKSAFSYFFVDLENTSQSSTYQAWLL